VRRLALGAVAAAAVILLAMLVADRPLALFLKSHEGLATEVFRRVTVLGEGRWYLMASAAALAAAVIAGRLATDPQRQARCRRWALEAGYVFAAVAVTGLSVDLLKVVVGRARPKLLFTDDFFGFHPFSLAADLWSMPSGHATTAGALAVALMLIWPRCWPVYLIGAGLIAASRVVITAHYLSDALAGLYLGAMGALVIAWIARRYETRR
jgi:undecaprenyl-diphosphatase